MIDVLIMGGTWNPGGDPVTEAFAQRLDAELFNYRYVPYPATYGGRDLPYALSVQQGRAALIEAIAEAPNPVLLAGYSQGAGIAGDVAAEYGSDPMRGLEVVGAALIADPKRPEGWGSSGIDGSGISGARPISTMPVWWAVADRDPITALPAGSALRSMADFTAYWNMSSLESFARWGQAIIDTAVQRRYQRWWSPANWRETSEVLSQANAYLFEGRHTTAYVAEGHCERMADQVNRYGEETRRSQRIA
ncbi:alpha/beta fold hydrolase [Nocardia sp. NPDC004722]